MRGYVLISGILIVVIGILEYSLLRGYFLECEDTIRQGDITPHLLQMCDQIKYAQYGSLLMSAIGFCVSIYGAVAKKILQEPIRKL